MDSWVEQLNRRARMVIDQIVAARVAAGSSKLELGWLEAQYRVLLEQLYAEEYAPARLRDTSDLIVRAEGPGADHDGPSLQSFTWLSDHIRRQLANLSRAVIPLSGADSKAVARKLGWTLTGYAPGSIMMGFALREPKSVPGFEKSDAQAFNAVRCAAQSIATIPQYVGETDIEIG
ncbi:MAG TPA: hypothetical protein VHX52_14405, partial [Steroidobacteraceae bacterium]|nr:hypothetical protein [Steroidobacteraceae bacterium]